MASTSERASDRLDRVETRAAISHKIEHAHDKEQVVPLAEFYTDLVVDVLATMGMKFRRKGEPITSENEKHVLHPVDWTDEDIPVFATTDYARVFRMEWQPRFVQFTDASCKIVPQPPVFKKRLAHRGVNWTAIKPMITAGTFASEWHNMELESKVASWFANHRKVHTPTAPLPVSAINLPGSNAPNGLPQDAARFVPDTVAGQEVVPGEQTDLLAVHPRAMEKLERFVPMQQDVMGAVAWAGSMKKYPHFVMSAAAANTLLALAFNAFVATHVVDMEPKGRWTVGKVLDFVNLVYRAIITHAQHHAVSFSEPVAQLQKTRLAGIEAMMLGFVVVLSTVSIHAGHRSLTLQSPRCWQEVVETARLLALTFRHAAIPHQR